MKNYIDQVNKELNRFESLMGISHRRVQKDNTEDSLDFVLALFSIETKDLLEEISNK